MQLLRTLEYVFHGSAISFLAFKYSSFTRRAVFGVFFNLLISLLPGTKSFPYCLEGMAKDHQSKPEAAVTSAAPARIKEVWDTQKTAYVFAARSPPRRGHQVTWNYRQNETGFFAAYC